MPTSEARRNLALFMPSRLEREESMFDGGRRRFEVIRG